MTDSVKHIQRLVLVTGPSGAGRSTCINVLEDLGYEVIDNLPIGLLPRLLDGPPLSRPLALGVDVRNRDFSTDAFHELIDNLFGRPDLDAQVLYVDADEDTLVRRYSETRRRHPLAPNDPPLTGILRERDLLVPIRGRADVLIDTSTLSPHDLRDEIEGWYATDQSSGMGVSVTSFSYKRGLPRGLDLVFDCRFLRNPHWEPSLRGLTGRDGPVDEYVAKDARFDDFFERVRDLIVSLLPAYREEGKSHLSVGFGCTGGQHRSVAVTERLAAALAAAGWQVSSRHRELERRAEVPRHEPSVGSQNRP
ncbi:RNase adapter RapZ [Pelagovum pacificum]|uniref:RNase adapter RapZ n=1 Tax=Pelagovum pacificum TaxID=2588711 RepID=A0A5C5G9G2_9RHOB|nr:RNase adapter RapZ [Pelagovum pacificum]QQA42303.1 RNase adapter RapZ [Pelagovum pacificum]TNY31388.1 RNase adapter RapZ [Pelagovum pacificum]